MNIKNLFGVVETAQSLSLVYDFWTAYQFFTDALDKGYCSRSLMRKYVDILINRVSNDLRDMVLLGKSGVTVSILEFQIKQLSELL